MRMVKAVAKSICYKGRNEYEVNIIGWGKRSNREEGVDEVGILSALNHLNSDILDCQADVCTKAAVSMVISRSSKSPGCLRSSELMQVRDKSGSDG